MLKKRFICAQEYALSTRPQELRLLQEAEEWFLDKENEYVFSFEFICETRGFHPGHIDRGLLAWRDAKRRPERIKPEAGPCAMLHRTRYTPKQYRLVKVG